MVLTQYGTPGGSLSAPGHAYGSAARVGAFFERRVAAALADWLGRRSEPTWLFHDLSGLRSKSRSGRKLDLGSTNIDHVLLTGTCWVMFDAKGLAPGRLVVEQNMGFLVMPSGEKRPQPWMDDTRAYARAGVLHDLTGLPGVPIWVVPEHVHVPADLHKTPPRILARGGVFCTIDEIATGGLETLPDLRPPLAAPDPQAIKALARLAQMPPSQVGEK
jgi:hypothetical protein